MKKLKRNYNSSDSYMLETASTIHKLFEENLADFTALDSTLDATFVSDWQAKILAATEVMHHSQVKDIATQKTEEVLGVMEECRLKYLEVKFFSGKAFKDSPGRQAEFGTDTYTKVRSKNANMISFMDEMRKACEKYQTDLLAAGMSQASIDEIETLRDSLMFLNTEQESFLKTIPVQTQERLEVLNSCYDSLRIVMDAAVVVYNNDYARRNMYVYLPTTGDKIDIEFVSQAILDEDPINVYSVDYVESRNFVLYNSGPAAVNFYLSDASDIITKKVKVEAGERISAKAEELGDDGNKLYVVLDPNTGTTADVEIEISLE